MGRTRDKAKRVIRKTLKWGGAGLTVLLVVVWIGSAWWDVGFRLPNGVSIQVLAGKVGVVIPNGVVPSSDETTFLFKRMDWKLGWWFDWMTQPVFRFCSIPLWLPVLLSLPATAAAWRVDVKYTRRARTGLCATCGYDRAGLAAGTACPECGKQAEAR